LDRNTITGLVLIFLVMIAWAYFSMPSQKEIRKQKAQERQDSVAAAQTDSQPASQPGKQSVPEDTEQAQQQNQQPEPRAEKQGPSSKNMGIFSDASESDTTETVVETPLYEAHFTNVGAGPSQIILKDQKDWEKKPVHLVKNPTHSVYSASFFTNRNKKIKTDGLVFKLLSDKQSFNIAKDDTTELKYALNISENKRIVYTYTLYGNSHQLGLDISFEGLDQNIARGGNIKFGWTKALQFTEKSPSSETSYVSAYAYTGGELEQLKLSEEGEKEQDYNGTIDWVSTRTKFFTQIIKTPNDTEGALLVGNQSGPADNDSTLHHYKSYITTDIGAQSNVAFQLFAGPMSFFALNSFNTETFNMVDVGYSWLRWMSEPLVRYVIIPYFNFADNFMGVGLAILLFAILIKMVLYPLTRKSYRSMAAMKELQPKMEEIKEKYDDEPEKQQKATMELYKEEGVNPLGGCLPNLLQLPILVTLWRFFHNSIMLRQQSFLWANDLSAPDYIIHLPFNIPFLGSQLGGFVLLMAAAMMVQSKMRGGMGGGGGGASGGPNMKALQYIFPFMLLFIFNSFAAGLSLYYLIYNVVSIIQQLVIYRQMDKEKEAEAA